jgi:RimJ/RimL family protein N-acetyltransferase
MIPVLETERLIMRGWRPDDAEPMAAIYGDEVLSRFIGGPLDSDGTWRLLAMEVGHWHLRGYGMWALEEKDGATFVGFCGLWEPAGWPELEVGWALAGTYQGRGYATEAAACARRYAYDDLRSKTLVSYIHPDNEPSKRVARRLGAVHDDTIELRGHPAEVFRHPAPQTIN